MKATNVLVGSAAFIFAVLLLGVTSELRGDPEGRFARGIFELFGALVSIYLLLRSQLGPATVADFAVAAAAIFAAIFGHPGLSVSVFALYLLLRSSTDQNARAASAVAMAVAVQAIWAPLLFSKISFFFLRIDAAVVGWLVSFLVPGTTWTGLEVSTPSEHVVAIYEACASFHNVSLASLCWVTLTMLHRQYWLKSDIIIGLTAALIQFIFNIWRLIFVCMSLPMYEFWHEGIGKHIFSAVATASAILFVRMSLIHLDRRGQKNPTLGPIAA